jgi:hypothetical protein
MRILLWGGSALGVLIALVAIVTAIGATLPVKHQVSISETFPLPPAQLFDLSVAIFNRTNDGKFAIVESSPPHRLVTAIAGRNLPFGGTWTYEFTPEGNATTVTITERGEVYNPFFRFVSRFVMGYEGSVRKVFAALRAAADQAPAKP